MKKINNAFCFLLFAFCFLPITLSAQKTQVLHDQNKVIRNKFTVQPKDVIIINTRDVNIVVEESGNNEIVFITTITLNKSTKEDMDNLMNALQMSNKQSGKTITYDFNITWSGKEKTNNLHGLTEVTLKIYAPKDVLYDFKTRYGNIEMENVHHDFNAAIAYGNLKVEDMFGNKNNIEIKYGNLTMEDLHGTRNLVDIKYGKFKIYKAEHLTLDIKYSQGEIVDVGSLQLDSKYGTLKFGAVKSLYLTSGYDKIAIQNQIDKIEGEMRDGTLSINALKNSCIFSSFAYSKINIEEVLRSLTIISLMASYSNIVLNIPRDLSFAIDYSGRYTDFKDEKTRWNYVTFEAGAQSFQMSGFYGTDQNTDKSVKIEARYGSVSLFGK
jgi:hypothetical protein